MTRRRFIQSGLTVGVTQPILAALKRERIEEAMDVLGRASRRGEVRAAVLQVTHKDSTFAQKFGSAELNSMFLLGSISKPICMTALMTLFDRGEFRPGDPLGKFIPQFKGDRRGEVTLQHLLTHTSGLPDQLAENKQLRSSNATLADFVEHAIRTPLQFAPGTEYQYSSMGILLAARVAEILSATEIRSLVDRAVLQPLKMRHSAQGLGAFKLEEMVASETEHAAPEAGGGDPAARDWDWNSAWWRKLGAPWGGTHSSAGDLTVLMTEFLEETGLCLKPETARLMRTNHNPAGLAPRGLGWNVGAGAGSKGCSESTFGHTGSTGTLVWADPATKTICVVLTSLPAGAVRPHPRDQASAAVAAAIG